jgi:thiol-disulfide isomerase/thioredoxin
VIAAILAAIAGFGTIYWVLAPSGNTPMGEIAGSEPPAEGSDASSSAAGGGKGALAELNRGEMAAFLVKSPPADVPEITFQTVTGEEKTLADLKGRVVLLNIWATWCHPCREEMPALDKLQADLGGADFEVVALNVDRGGGGKPKQFLEEVGAEHLALYEDPTGKAGFAFGSRGMPTTILLDSEGKELGRLVGPAEWASEDALRLIRTAIAADKAASRGEGAASGDSGA